MDLLISGNGSNGKIRLKLGDLTGLLPADVATFKASGDAGWPIVRRPGRIEVIQRASVFPNETEKYSKFG
jgi:hypothetical protein